MNELRINKFIARASGCSRREADRLIAEGRVRVGEALARPGLKVSSEDIITLDGHRLGPKEAAGVVCAFYKPRGLVCTRSSKDRAPTVYEYIEESGWPAEGLRLESIGRLDKDSEGLLILTNRGELAYKATRAAGAHEKEYIVSLRDAVNDDFLDRLRKGVRISIPSGGSRRGTRNVTARPVSVQKISERSIDIVLVEGMNREIRRMAEALGNRVRTLKRIRFMNITLRGLGPGELREITGDELHEFERELS